jgi:hypothetical protein
MKLPIAVRIAVPPARQILQRLQGGESIKSCGAFTRLATDDLKISELKRQKLQLKDEIERLRHDIVL